MPELPEVEALVAFLRQRAVGHRVTRAELAAIAALKTVDPPLDALVGTSVTRCERRGKFLCLAFAPPAPLGDDAAASLWLVVHLARGGWLKWSDRLPATRARPTRSPIALRLGLDDGSGFDLTEMGTEKRLALSVVHDPSEVPGVASLGIDPLDPAFDVAALARLATPEAGTVKTMLSSQSLIAGVGNAYSDEALHVARLSPFKRASALSEDELGRLHDAVVSVLTEATDRAVGNDASALKGEKHRAMRVHGRTGEPCPVCGDVVRQVSFATRSLQYCATCQTGGKPLADRRLSRLLK
ncbi:MAG TPA: DNA-formamidopyrimidine glycosylase family protein [Acidimicrobiales bacterium]|nr:DNA-formamidopyrimidine glycosylase family protein [Acidimicrobiales bacterium]